MGGNRFCAKGENPGCQTFYGDPGENEKAGVVGQEVQVFDLGCLVPPDELISCSHSPGGGPPSQTGNGAVADEGNVFEVVAHDLAVAQVVIPMDEAVVEGLKGSASNQSETERFQVGKIAGEGAVVNCRKGDASVSDAVTPIVEAGRELDESFSVEGQKDFPAGHVFETAVWLEPAPLAAQYPGDSRAAQSPVRLDSPLNLDDIRLRNGSISYGQGFHDHCIAA
jgi:hypothetical protein